MKRFLAGVALLCATLVLALLWGATSAYAAGGCPVGQSTMGCSLPTPLKGVSAPPAGEIVPDVSSYQGVVNWQAVKTWQLSHGWKTTGGIFKLGETVIDPHALWNARALEANHMAAIGYVFVRPGLRASTVIGWAHQTGIRVVVLDEEVPGIQGTAGRVTPALKAAGLTVVDYHSAANIYDTTADGLPCWVADYGPSHAPSCTTGVQVAWQFTDIGSIPGIHGLVDESISYGLLRLAAPPLVCWQPTGRLVSGQPACGRVVSLYRWLVARRDFWAGQFDRCIVFADGIGCARAEHWWLLRREQAIRRRKKYS